MRILGPWMLALLFLLAGCLSSFEEEWVDPEPDDDAGDDDAGDDDDSGDDDTGDDDTGDDDTGDDDTGGGTPDITVSPITLSIDPAYVGQATPSDDISIRHDGNGTLNVYGIGVSDDPAGILTVQSWDGQVAPSQNQIVSQVVIATCTSEGSFYGEIEVASDDPDEATVPVSVGVTCHPAQ